jgi:hypothetical protein
MRRSEQELAIPERPSSRNKECSVRNFRENLPLGVVLDVVGDLPPGGDATAALRPMERSRPFGEQRVARRRHAAFTKGTPALWNAIVSADVTVSRACCPGDGGPRHQHHATATLVGARMPRVE